VLVAPGDPVVPESPAELVVRVALAGLVVRVAEQELNRVEGLELVRVAAVPELVRVAVPLKTKSVIAARRLDQVPLLEAAVDLAAAAETTRAPAATEAAAAWAAAV
jgi:hypothetical protein